MKIKKNCIAIGSGKGGVGKSTTSLNLAVYYAKTGKKTLLLDLDPLSNVRTILDIDNQKSEKTSPEQIFENFFLLSPFLNAGVTDPSSVYKNIADGKYYKLKSSFDTVIFDLPAGSDQDENIAFLDFADILLVVTNPEPSAHVAAAGYIKKVLNYKNDIPVYIWNNRYERKTDSTFNPDDLFGNYNRNVAENEKISEDVSSRVMTVARIPSDPALDLLGTETTFGAVALRNMLILLELIYSEITQGYVNESDIGLKLSLLLNSFAVSNKIIKDPKIYLNDLFIYLGVFINRFSKNAPPRINLFELLTDEESNKLIECIEKIKNCQILALLRKTISITETTLTSVENSGRMFYTDIQPDRYNSINREAGELLTVIENNGRNKNLNKLSGILLFYLSIFKLLRIKEFHQALTDFMPVKKDSKNNTIRDRHSQIRELVEKNSDYQKKFLKLVKYFHLPLLKEIEDSIASLELKKTPLTVNEKGKTEINKNAYIKLLSSYLHDSVNSGLSIITGFSYRTASISFQKSADILKEILNG